MLAIPSASVVDAPSYPTKCTLVLILASTSAVASVLLIEYSKPLHSIRNTVFVIINLITKYFYFDKVVQQLVGGGSSCCKKQEIYGV